MTRIPLKIIKTYVDTWLVTAPSVSLVTAVLDPIVLLSVEGLKLKKLDGYIHMLGVKEFKI